MVTLLILLFLKWFVIVSFLCVSLYCLLLVHFAYDAVLNWPYGFCVVTLITKNWTTMSWVNLLKPTGYMMHHQFNIQQLYALPTLYLCVLYLSENKQRLVPLTA